MDCRVGVLRRSIVIGGKSDGLNSGKVAVILIGGEQIQNRPQAARLVASRAGRPRGGVGINQLKNFESGLTAPQGATIAALRTAKSPKQPTVQFIAKNGGGAGVRLLTAGDGQGDAIVCRADNADFPRASFNPGGPADKQPPPRSDLRCFRTSRRSAAHKSAASLTLTFACAPRRPRVRATMEPRRLSEGRGLFMVAGMRVRKAR